MQIDENDSQVVESSSRDARISLRVPSAQAALLKQAAEENDTTLTDFVLSSASIAAQHVLADRRWFRLSPESWEAFEAALERPAVYKPRLSDTVRDDSFFVD
ncbi:MAG TPA: DUF1778 domain-containing protein [Pseudolysinimonas sp.]|jgi:uncharacterized protein (DUF1778 family)